MKTTSKNNDTLLSAHSPERPVIYQMLPRLHVNYCENPARNGTIHTNGSGKLNAINDNVLDGIKKLGATHVWYTGVIEHSHDADYTRWGIRRDNPQVVKGRAGSPYAITDYYDIDPDLAEDVPNRMAEFEALVERTHRHGLKVVIDFVPNHVAREYNSDSAPEGVEPLGAGDDQDVFFSPTNNFYYIPRQRFAPRFPFDTNPETGYVEFPAKASGNDCFTAFPSRNDWYDTVKLNYGVDPFNGSRHFDPIPPTWFKMLHIIRFWASKGIDALRCDMVHMVPVEFWHWAIDQVKQEYPHLLFIAEIYEPALYRPYIFHGGFDYLYDKVSLYDTLRGIQCNNVSAARLTSCWQTVEGISSKMLSFIENHDEQRYASQFFAGDPNTVTPLLVAIATMNTGAVMIYGGQELGEPAAESEGFSGVDGRTTIFDYWSIEKLRRMLDNGTCKGKLTAEETNLRALYARVLGMVNASPALREGSFFDLMYVNYANPHFDPHRQYAFLRHAGDETLLVVLNFDNRDVDTSINIPQHAFDVLGIKPIDSASTIEMLSGEQGRHSLTSQVPVSIKVPKNGAAILKFAPQDNITVRKAKKTSINRSPKTKK